RRWPARWERRPSPEPSSDLIADGGCLVLEGDEQSGRPQAAGLLEETLDGFGYRVIRADVGGGRPISVRALLLDIWKELSPPTAGLRCKTSPTTMCVCVC